MPRIGLLSDSHGRDAITRRAVSVLLGRGAEMLIHLGDIAGPFGGGAVLDALAVASPGADGPVPAHVVFGNNDDPDALTPYARSIGLQVDHPQGWMRLGARWLVYLHGDDGRAMREAVLAEVAYLCHGHTHVKRDAREGKTRVINPGALHRASGYSVALLDTEADRLAFYPVSDRG